MTISLPLSSAASYARFQSSLASYSLTNLTERVNLTYLIISSKEKIQKVTASPLGVCTPCCGLNLRHQRSCNISCTGMFWFSLAKQALLSKCESASVTKTYLQGEKGNFHILDLTKEFPLLMKANRKRRVSTRSLYPIYQE